MSVGSRSARAKQQAAMAMDYGVDELSSAMSWKKAWLQYKEDLARVRRDAKKKGGLMSFISTALFAVAGFFTAGMSTIAQAGISFAAGGIGSMLGDEIAGDIEGVAPPKVPKRKYHQSKEVEKTAEFEGAYTTLNEEIKIMEDEFNQMHWQNPLKLTMMFYGKELLGEITGGTLFGSDTSSVTVDPDAMAAMSGPGGYEGYESLLSQPSAAEIMGAGQDVGSIIDPVSGLDITSELASINDPLFEVLAESNSDVAQFSMENIFTNTFNPETTEGMFQWDAGYNLILQEIIGGDEDETIA